MKLKLKEFKKLISDIIKEEVYAQARGPRGKEKLTENHHGNHDDDSMAEDEIVKWMEIHGKDPSVTNILNNQEIQGLSHYLNMIPTFDAFSKEDIEDAIQELEEAGFFDSFTSTENSF